MPIDFSKLIKHLTPPKPPSRKLKGLRTHCVTGITKEVDLELEVERNDDVWVIKIHGGPTGYESVQMDESFREQIKSGEGSWLACMGRKDHYDRLEIPFANLNEAIRS